MDQVNMTAPIATRRLVLRGKQDQTVEVIMGVPQQFPGSDDYYCPYEILGMGGRCFRYAVGIDAIQALQLALRAIGADLYLSAEFVSGELSWDGAEQGELGFPRP